MGKLRNILGVLFVTLYLCHYVSNNFFIHTHYYKWGKVTHSHPYLPIENNTEHNHSAAQLSFISGANQQGFLNFEFISAPALFLILLFSFTIAGVFSFRENSMLLLKGRSPPAC